MKSYKITVNGNTYDVGVEEVGGAPVVQSVQAAPKAAPAPAPAPKAEPKAAPKAAKEAAPAKSGDGGDVTAPLNGTVMSISVAEGDTVKVGQTLLLFEAMKMENELASPFAGTVKKIHVAKGGAIETGMVVVTIG